MQTKEDFYMEIKKIRWQKIILAMPVLMMLLFCTGLNVHAEEVKDGISVTVSSDKKNYSSEDEVKLKVTVKNTNDFEVSDIKIENILPDGISLISGNISKDNINLKANEETIMNLSVKKVSTGQTATTSNTINNSDNSEKNTTVSKAEKFPNTGDNNNTLIALIVMLVSVAVIIVCLMLKDRKKYSKFLSILICLGVINAFGITGIVHATSTSNNSFTYEFTYKINNIDYIHKVVVSYSYDDNNNFDYYYDIEVEVDKEVDDVLHSTNLSIDEKKDKILEILYKFEKEKKITEGSIEYMEDEKIICFQYLDGLDCMIELEERVSGFSGIATKEDYVAEYKYYDKTTGKFFEYYDSTNNEFQILDIPLRTNNVDFSNSNYPFPEEKIQKLDLNAKYMYGLCGLAVNCDYCENFKFFKNNQTNWNNIHLKTDIDSYCTVEDFKTGLCGYDIVFIEEHGGVTGLFNKVTLIGTFEEYNKTSKKNYKDDYKNLTKCKQNNSTKDYWAIKPSFFEKYYGNNKLKDTIVWIGSCYGYMNDDLVNAFEKSGASAVIGYSDSVATNYDTVLHNAFVYSLMHGDTVLDALEFSKSIWKSDDVTYFYSFLVNKGIESPFKGAVAKVNAKGENAKLIYLPYYSSISGKVTDEDNNPIPNAKISIHNIRGMSYGIEAVTNENGEYTLECPQDSYTISVKADGYEVFETDEFISVSYNNETTFNITLKKETEITKPDNIIAEGICGDNLTWTLDNKGQLIIKGTGEMYDYADVGSPFYKYKQDIKNVTISDDVTYIGENAFAYCENLENINLPDGLTIISYGCFKGCKSLKKISIPESVTKLGLSVFNNCEQLTNIKLPDNLKEIDSSAFNGCTNLIDIAIPESVEVLGSGAFTKCSKLKSITIHNNIKNISSDTFAYCTSLTSITIAKDVEIGGKNVFYKTPNVVIYGYIGTSAEKYAKSNQIPFVNLDNSTSIENKTWQQLYADELKRYMTSDEYKTDSMFDLYDVNNDDIPELFISTGTSHDDGCFVYTVLNGQLKELEKHDDWTCGEYGLINCSSSIQTIFSSWSQLGHYYIDYYQIQNDKFVHLLKAYTDVADVGLENATYKINDETVIVKKYNEEISKYEADDYVKIGRKYTLDEKTINSVLLNEQETTEDLIIETVKLTNDDIKPEWEHVTSLNLEYPVFKSKDTELQDFLTNFVTEKILGYMETNSDYPCVSIYGNFEYDMSVNGYLSISAYISNRPSDSGTGTYTIPYTFFVDLQNKKILSLNDLFLETEDTIYKEVAIKAAKYNKSHAQHDTLLNYNYKECKFILTKDNLILTFNPYSISSGADGIINIEIPLTDLDLTCIIS